MHSVSLERDTVDQIVHVPIHDIQEQIVEGVKEISQERVPEQTVEQIENATPVVEDMASAPVKVVEASLCKARVRGARVCRQ